MKKILLWLVLLASICSCRIPGESAYFLYFDNNCDFNVYYHCNFSSVEARYDVIYPDTVLRFKKEALIKIEPKSRFHDNMPLDPISTWIERLPQDTLSVYFFDQNTLDMYSWNDIQQGYKILQRYDLSADDIRQLEDEYGIPVITYPPTEAMKNMKMYPPYVEK